MAAMQQRLESDDDKPIQSAAPNMASQPQDRRSKYRYNPFCRLAFCWIDPLMWLGFKRPLLHSDLYVHPRECDAQHLLNKFNRYWSTELSNGGSPSLLRVLVKCISWRIIAHGMLQLVENIILVCLSLLIGLLSSYFVIDSPTSTDTRNAYLYALAIFLLSLVTVFIHGLAFHYSYYLGVIIRYFLSSAIYQKILSLSHVTVNKVTLGHIVNLASNDLHRFDMCLGFFHYLWIGPFHLVVMTYFLWHQIGWCSFIAAGLIVMQLPIQIVLMMTFTKLKFKAARMTDKRIKIMNEVITGIRVIKMYAWEYPFHDLVANIRKSEVWLIAKASIIQAINSSYFSLTQPVIMFIVFSVYVTFTPPEGDEGVLTPRKVFTTISLVSFVRLSVIFNMAGAVTQLSEARVAFKRVKDFLLLPELSNKSVRNTESKDDVHQVYVDELTASWSMDPDNLVLENVSFSIDKSKPLLAVVGKVGSGKSTLLQCLLKELPCLSGSVSLEGTTGYASQEAWIFSATVRENVTFGLPYQSDWYNQVIECCALDKDIDILPEGDLTLVGERGVTLSGGQKARVNLARAVYRNANVYLLDDPLSAVDAVVSRHIFDRCIRDMLSNKLVVLVTHQLQYLQQCDSVLVLNEGRVSSYGNPLDVLSGGDLIEFLEDDNDKEDDPRNVYVVRKQTIIPTTTENNGSTNGPNSQLLLTPNVTSEEVNDELIEDTDLNPLLPAVEIDKDKCDSATAEDKDYGTVSFKTYVKYFRAGGTPVAILLLIFLFFYAESNLVVADWWISEWSTCAVNSSTSSHCLLSNNERIGIYGGLVLSAVVSVVTRYSCLLLLLLNSSRILHNKMFASVIRAPILFFDNSPIGRILNRFSKDVGFMDDVLPLMFTHYLTLLLNAMAILITILIANPVTIVSLVFFLVILLVFRWYYLRSAREIKRLEAIARSPVYSHISLTLQGLSTIRSYSMEPESTAQFHKYLNSHSQASYIYLVTARWFSIRTDFACALYIGFVAFVSVAIAGWIKTPALVGLALTYVIILNGLFQFCLKLSAEVESLMISAERVMAYGLLESEASLETEPPASKPSNNWPSQGLIALRDLSYRHSSDGPTVLKGLTCTINKGEKVGIVGRTGAGKSSLVSSLFRLAEPCTGSIIIDDIDICSIGLHDIRSKLSIIPQDPVLFGGTVRYNMDPFHVFDDDALWKALEQVQLKELVQSHDGLLDGEVHEGGGNFSVGQRQLFCLARALLRNNKILILDEATANVDLETDGIIQQVIRDQFNECTVLTVAHRLDTVMDSDRIMVLRTGVLCEFDEPHVLLSNPSSYLTHLVDHTGVTASNRLKEMAATAYKRRRTSISIITPL